MTDAPPDFDQTFQDRFDDLIEWRRDVRHFLTDPLPDGVLEDLLATADRAPSVGLSQPWRFVLVETPQYRAAIKANFEACNADALKGYDGEQAALYAQLKLQGLDQAPVQIAVFTDPDPTQGKGLGRKTMPQTLDYSTVGAIQTFWLAARVQGVGVGWLSILDPDRIATDLDVPADWRFIAYLCVGYPERPSSTPELEKKGWEDRSPVASRIFQR